MANSNGGSIYLGIEEVKPKDKSTSYRAIGVEDLDRVLKTLWNGLNNRKCVNINILRDSDVEIQEIGTKKVIEIQVPRAPRRSRPVYVGDNPMTGSYRRNHDGDYHCTESEVRRMIADADNDSLDTRILERFTAEDLDDDSVKRYRQILSSTKPNHPYLSNDPKSFLISIGAYGCDRETNVSGLTAAGLLMFGKYRSILDTFPRYHVEYRHIDKENNDRWVDRLSSDGSWSGNLFESYQRASRKLTAEISIPFSLVDGQRIDDSHVSEALREAFVNTLIHADYSSDLSILIEKLHDEYRFRNPGTMRIEPRQAFEGNRSDCRNRNLQTMFLLIGAAEKAGSGLPKIARAWKEQAWRFPQLRESVSPEETTLSLRTAALLPEESLSYIETLFGDRFKRLQREQVVALCTAHQEESVTNLRMQDFCADHPREITKMLQRLVLDGYLTSHGATSGTYYKLSTNPEYQNNSSNTTEAIRLVLSSRRVSDDVLRQAIRDIASDYLTLKQIAEKLNISTSSLRRYHIPAMIQLGLLEAKDSSSKSPKQAYRATATTSTSG